MNGRLYEAKPRWKPVGLDAKKWRAAAYAKQAKALLSSKLLREQQARRKKTKPPAREEMV
jgi:hypothetical protein